MNYNKNSKQEVIGLLPAAGRALRIAPLPCSKELFPIGFRTVDESNTLRPKVVSHYLLEKMRLANIKKVYIILRRGKWDIPAYYGDGKMLDMNLAYLMMDLPYGVPYTLDQAYPFVQDSIVALGFPDMIIQPEDAFVQLLKKQAETKAAIVLGLFPALQPHKTDMVEIDKNGKIRSIQIKPDHTTLEYTWEIAIWTPEFTYFMHEYLLSHQEKYENNQGMEEQKELFVGDIIHASIKNNLQVDSVLFKDGSWLDIGTPEDLIRAIQITDQIPIEVLEEFDKKNKN